MSDFRPLISIVLVNWNGMKWLDKCVQSIMSQSYKHYEILLVDNSSPDKSADYVKNKYKSVKVYIKSNQGYGSACNYGARKARGEFLMFFNEDMHVDSHYLQTFVDFYNKIEDKKTVGTIGCRLDNYDKSRFHPYDYYGYSIDFLGSPIPNFIPERIFHNSGCPLFISRKLFLKIKGFCPNIFIYSEDVDLCWRLTLFGYKHYFINNTALFHAGGGSVGQFSPKKLVMYITGEINALLDNYSSFSLLLVMPVYTTYYLMMIVFFLATLRPEYSKVIISTFYVVFIKNFDKIIKFRNFVQRNRRVSEYEIFKKINLFPSRLMILLARSRFVS